MYIVCRVLVKMRTGIKRTETIKRTGKKAHRKKAFAEKSVHGKKRIRKKAQYEKSADTTILTDHYFCSLRNICLI